MSDKMSSQSEQARRNADLFRSMKDQEIVSWLIRGLNGKGFAPLRVRSRSSKAHQIRNLFAELDIDQQERLKAASAQALGEWVYGIHSTDLLKELAIVAAFIGAGSAVDQIRIKLEYLRPEAFHPKEYRDIVGTLIAVAQGFAPLTQVQHLFQRLFFDDKYEQFAAQLFLGLCACDPTEYPTYVPRFLDVYNRSAGRFSAAIVWDEFVRIVSFPGIIDGSKKLDPDSWGRLYDLLTLYELSPFRLVHWPLGGIQVVSRRGLSPTIILSPRNIPKGRYSYLNYYESSKKHIKRSGGPMEMLQSHFLETPIG